MKKIKIGAVLFLLITLTALCAPLLSPHLYHETHLAIKNTAPSTLFLFGTDELGRDLFVRICFGVRISLLISLAASGIDLIIGLTYGTLAALSGRRIQILLGRLLEILATVPNLLLATFLTILFGCGIRTIIIALSITGWIGMARMVRAHIWQLQTEEFMIAATSLGASRPHLLRYHLLPHLFDSILVTVSLTIPSSIFAEAFLSFLGLGVQAPLASLGSMANEGIVSLRYYPWRFFFPAGTIYLLILSLNLLADGLQERRERC